MRFGIALAFILWLSYEVAIAHTFPYESNEFYLSALKGSVVPVAIGFFGGWWLDPFRRSDR